jgi:metallo-beta-lactamase class B
MFARALLPFMLLLAACSGYRFEEPRRADILPAQHAWKTACGEWDEWDKPGPPFRIYGDTYYVGTCGIASVLVADPDGLTLIDSGTDEGAKIVLDNIRKLGFDPRDVKAILMSHEHFDHVGGMARLQAATGATIFATPDAARVLRSGLPDAADPQANSGHPPFPPVTGPISTIDTENPLRFGDTAFHPLLTPGHTPGAMSWWWQECEGYECETIAYVDSLNPISADDYRFSDHPEYLAAFRAALAKVAALDCNFLITPHPDASTMRERLGQRSHRGDTGQCRRYARAIGERLDKRLAEEGAR